MFWLKGDPLWGLTLEVRYAPFMTTTRARKIPETLDRNHILERVLDLAAEIEPGRPIRPSVSHSEGPWAALRVLRRGNSTLPKRAHPSTTTRGLGEKFSNLSW